VSRPLPTPPRDPRLDELFARYWDNALSDAEAAELDRRLASDPAARDWFRFLSLQAAVVAEGSAVARVSAVPAGGWSRRRVLRYVGAGLAAGVAAVVVGRRMTEDAAEPVRLAVTTGDVLVRDEAGRTLAAARAVPPGGTVSTRGAGSSAVLAYPDGIAVALAGDSALTVAATGRRLELRRGHATADVRPPGSRLVLATAVATLTGLGGAVTTLSHVVRATAVCVHQGRVTVSDPDGEQLAVVGAGEQFTVREDGCHKCPLPEAPDEYAWDLTRPLPDEWAVGRRVVTAAGPVVVPECWPDPYYNDTQMYQVRSHQPWATGFFRLHPDSVVRVRYRAADTGPGQVCFCVRKPDPRSPDTGVVEYNGTFEETPAGGWHTLEVPAAELLDNRHAPRFNSPWIGFLIILNTYEADLGLEVAEFRVTRPGGVAG
jgi:ferric-dicitrate binding protein FerR (iron transport regulator)